MPVVSFQSQGSELNAQTRTRLQNCTHITLAEGSFRARILNHLGWTRQRSPTFLMEPVAYEKGDYNNDPTSCTTFRAKIGSSEFYAIIFGFL